MSSPLPDPAASPSFDSSPESAEKSAPSSPPFFENEQGLWEYLEANPHIPHPYRAAMKGMHYVEIPDSEDETTRAGESARREDWQQLVLRQRANKSKNVSCPTTEIDDAPHDTINIVTEEIVGTRQDIGVNTIAEAVSAQQDTIAVETTAGDPHVNEVAARYPFAEGEKKNGRQKCCRRNLVEVLLEEDLDEKHKWRKILHICVPDMSEGSFKLEMELSEHREEIGLTVGVV